jgi:cephalosporin-C deacetylase-like acetyl esterase
MFDTSLCSSIDPSCEHFRDSSRFEAFDIYDVVYKTVMAVELMTLIMIPKGLRDVTCPLLVHFHGMLNSVVIPYIDADETDNTD